MKRLNYKRQQMHPAIAIAAGTIVSVILGAALGAVSAYVTLTGNLEEQHMQLAVLAIHLLSMLTGGWIAMKFSETKNIWPPMCVIVAQILLLLSAHILIIDAPISVTWMSVVSALGAAAIFVLLQVLSGRKGKFKYRN